MKLEEIHLKEYEKLQTEINQILAEISSLEKFAVTASGSILTWILTNKANLYKGYNISLFIPLLLTIAFGLIAYGLFERLKLISQYIKDKYESGMNPSQTEEPVFGWETYLDKSLNNKSSLLANARLWMWLLLLLADFIVAIIYMCPPDPCK